MQQTLTWNSRSDTGVETLRLSKDASGIHASSHLMQVIRGDSIVASYLIDCDLNWRFRRLWLKVDNNGQRSLCLQRDLRGNWVLDGKPRPDLYDCQHIMLSASPFTHTPPLQRCALEAGQSDKLRVAYVDMLSLKIEPRQHHYQCLHRQSGEGLYRSLGEDATSEELSVDAQALLLNTSERYQRLRQGQLSVNTLV